MTAHSTMTAGSGDILLSVRETRLIVERILLLTDLPSGTVPAVRELVIAAEAMGKQGLKHLFSHFEALRSMSPTRLRVAQDDGDCLLADADGEHAWAVGPALLELAVDLCRQRDRGMLVVNNLREPCLLEVLAPVALRYHTELTVTAGSESGSVSITAIDRREPATGSDNDIDAFLTGMLRRGFLVSRGLWSDIYHLSNQSLTPDSVVSRRHAGPIIVDENGRIIGRTDDDETDFSLLSKPVDTTAAA